MDRIKLHQLINQVTEAKFALERAEKALETFCTPAASRVSKKKSKWSYHSRKKLSIAMKKKWGTITPEHKAKWTASIRNAKQKGC